LTNALKKNSQDLLHSRKEYGICKVLNNISAQTDSKKDQSTIILMQNGIERIKSDAELNLLLLISFE
jgi:hypothetical protein